MIYVAAPERHQQPFTAVKSEKQRLGRGRVRSNYQSRQSR